MSKVKPNGHVKTLSGKISKNSSMMFVTNSQTEEVFTRVIGERDLEKHPVTERERNYIPKCAMESRLITR